MKKEILKQILMVARGESLPELLIKNVKILNLVTGESEDSAIAIIEGYIAGIGSDYKDGKNIFDGKGATVVPGFIDSHMHLESTLMHPFEFERVTLPLGTTTIVSDPHEMTNVMGVRGLEWYLRCSELTHQNQYIQISSCVPALKDFETNFGEIKLSQMKKYRSHPNVLGMAEMMNFPGVIAGDDDVLDKIEAFSDMSLDGHCPALTGKELNAYLAAGISNCHETISSKEAIEKISKGMSVMIREGSVAKNLDDLAPVITEFNSTEFMLCTDDRNPYDIFTEGHINSMIKRLINDHKIPTHVAYRVASYSAAKHFGLKRTGLIAPGYKADMVLISNLNDVTIDDVLIDGKFVSQISFKDRLLQSKYPVKNSIKRKPVSPDHLKYNFGDVNYNLIEIIPDQLITNKVIGKVDENDVAKLVVLERYGNNEKPSIGLVKGMGVERGAIASSVAHDSHNLISLGKNDNDMSLAFNTLINSGGGFCVVLDGQLLTHLPLPIGGLVSLSDAETISSSISDLKKSARELGITLAEPFLQLAFLSLPVIPSIKLTNKGLIDVDQMKIISLRSDGE